MTETTISLGTAAWNKMIWMMLVSSLVVVQSLGSDAAASASSSSSSSKRPRELIINGHDAPRGRFPYFTTMEHTCGGALIAPDTVLTAGHCLPKHKHSVKPRVGRYSFVDDKDENFFDIIAMDRPSNWKALGEDEFRHDVSLLFLDVGTTGPLLDVPYIKLNRNGTNLPQPGQQVTAMGVGWTSNDYEHAKKAHVLQEVHLNYLPNDQCELASNENDDNTTTNDDNDDDEEEEIIRYMGRIHPDHLCTTGGPNNERDACAYDSGSPIILEGESAEEDILVGLVSWGEGCADPDFPAVNTRISDAMDFIERSVCEHSAYPPPEFNCPARSGENSPSDIEPTTTTTESPSSSSPTEAPMMPPPPPQQQQNQDNNNNNNNNDNDNTPIPPSHHHQHHMLCHLVAFMTALLLLIIVVHHYRRKQMLLDDENDDNSNFFKWMPGHGNYDNKQSILYSSETEYLYQSSPASSQASNRSGGSADYNAIEISDV